MIDRGLGVLPQPPAQTFCSALMTLFMQIGASQVGNWPYIFQSAMEVQWQFLTLWDVRRYAQDGFLKVSQPSTYVKGKPFVLPHLPCSPDLASSDFHLFGPLKDTLHGTRVEDDDSVIRAARTWLREQETSWYREGMHSLVSRWHKAVDLDGDYVEK